MAAKRQMHLTIPLEQDWPVIGQEPDGTLILQDGFRENVERLNGLKPGSLSGAQLLKILLAWYDERRRIGFPADAAMESAARRFQAA